MSALNCLIDIGSTFDCNNPSIGGVVEELILINKKDFDNATVTFDPTSNAITIITLALGKQGYVFSGQNNDIQPSSIFKAVDGGVSGYDHQIIFRAYDLPDTDNQADRDNLAKLRFGSVVAVVKNRNKTYDVYGRSQGLLISDWQDLQADPASGGTTGLTIKTSDGVTPEVFTKHQWITTDFATTEPLVDLLKAPAV